MGMLRKAVLEFDISQAEGVADKLLIASEEFDRTATRVFQAAAEARKAAAELNKACDRARLIANKR